MEQLIKLCEKFNCKYLQNEKMSLHTTFKIGGNARLVVYPQNEEQISELVKCAKAENVRLIAVGNGSNLLVDDDGIDACVLILGEPFSQIKLIDDETIYAKAGAKLIALCRFAYEHSLSGLEFAYGIPGSAGGAAFMNAGAYGGEMKDVLYKCEHIDKNGDIGFLEYDDLKLSYLITAIFAQIKHVLTSCAALVYHKSCVLFADLRTAHALAFKIALLNQSACKISLRTFKR